MGRAGPVQRMFIALPCGSIGRIPIYLCMRSAHFLLALRCQTRAPTERNCRRSPDLRVETALPNQCTITLCGTRPQSTTLHTRYSPNSLLHHAGRCRTTSFTREEPMPSIPAPSHTITHKCKRKTQISSSPSALVHRRVLAYLPIYSIQSCCWSRYSPLAVVAVCKARTFLLRPRASNKLHYTIVRSITMRRAAWSTCSLFSS